MNAFVELRTSWDDQLLQTADLQPKGSMSVLMDFALKEDAIDAGLPDLVRTALATGLTDYGVVAGRWFESEIPIPPEATLFHVQSRPFLRRVIEGAFSRRPVPVVTAREPKIIAELLDQGWSVQHQALLVFDPYSRTPLDQALEALSTNRNWSEFNFPSPAKVLVTPGVDGDFILVTAAIEHSLKGVLKSLASSFGAAGFSFPTQE